MKAEERIFVAMDVTKKRFDELIQILKTPTSFKIGFPLFLKIGKKGLDKLKKKGKKLFLDFKFFDIPNTMIQSAESVIDLGADFFTVHLSSGEYHLRKVVEKVKEQTGNKVKILGVSILTSFSEIELSSMNISNNILDQVLTLAEIGKKAGIDGIVSSPQELRVLKKEFGDSFIYVTPGIRPSWSRKNDQKRVMGFNQALKEGATYTVIGRPITKAKNPEKEFRKILERG